MVDTENFKKLVMDSFYCCCDNFGIRLVTLGKKQQNSELHHKADHLRSINEWGEDICSIKEHAFLGFSIFKKVDEVNEKVIYAKEFTTVAKYLGATVAQIINNRLHNQVIIEPITITKVDTYEHKEIFCDCDGCKCFHFGFMSQNNSYNPDKDYYIMDWKMFTFKDSVIYEEEDGMGVIGVYGPEIHNLWTDNVRTHIMKTNFPSLNSEEKMKYISAVPKVRLSNL